MEREGENSPVYLFCWFDEAEWNKLRELSPDGLDDSYQTWRREASKSFTEIKAQGHNVKKVSIKIEAFKKWCDANGKEYGSATRSEYVAVLAQKASKK